MKAALSKMQGFIRDEQGVTAIEYGLLTALISVVIIAAVTAVGTNLNTMFTTIANDLTGGGAG